MQKIRESGCWVMEHENCCLDMKSYWGYVRLVVRVWVGG